MKIKRLIECVSFFKELKVDVKKEAHQGGKKTVWVEYHYQGNTYPTKPLLYEAIGDESDPEGEVRSYFGDPVYWLNNDVHDWPYGTGTEIEHRVIKDMIHEGDIKTENFLKTLANNDKTGYIQQITFDGRDQYYGFNLENNNHWHDLVLLIQEVIKHEGKPPSKEFFSPLVFHWCKKEPRIRKSLSQFFGSRKILRDLYTNIQSISYHMELDNLKKLLYFKNQIILQGPPGTGKTRTAKDLAYEIVFDKPIDPESRDTQIKELECSKQFEFTQFHPTYSYEDFVRGIFPKVVNGQVNYVTENKVIGDLAEKACQSQDPIDFLNKFWVEEYLKYLAKKLDKQKGDVAIGKYSLSEMY